MLASRLMHQSAAEFGPRTVIRTPLAASGQAILPLGMEVSRRSILAVVGRPHPRKEILMVTRYFALILGIVFLLIGVLGFVPAFVTHPAGHDMATGTMMDHGYLFGLFPVNALHNIVHLLFGLWGVLSFGGVDASHFYARGVAIIYALLAILGLMPAPVNTLWGMVPIHGNDVWLHALIAVAAAIFGWSHIHERTDTTTDTSTMTPSFR
jgi:hypothetical protein